MSRLRRIVLVRHGETEGASSVRFHGRTDVALSAIGRRQARAAREALGSSLFDLVVASPMRRSWQSAWIVARGGPIRLIGEFREIDFGRWEGLSREEIAARDPILYADWQAGTPGFEFPAGERRETFRERVRRGLEILREDGARSALAVLHKGVIRALLDELGVEALDPAEPALGGIITLTRDARGSWFRGMHGSDPAALSAQASSDSRSRASTL